MGEAGASQGFGSPPKMRSVAAVGEDPAPAIAGFEAAIAESSVYRRQAQAELMKIQDIVEKLSAIDGATLRR